VARLASARAPCLSVCPRPLRRLCHQATLLGGAARYGPAKSLPAGADARFDNTTLSQRAAQARWVLSAEATGRALAIVKATREQCAARLAYCPRWKFRDPA